jgi:hypothetical protein
VDILPEHAPDNPATPVIPVVDPVRQAEIALEITLDELENRRVLQASNRLSIESLVNPDSEKDIIDDLTEQDIYNAVVASRNAQKMGEINGGDDEVEDNMGFQPPQHIARLLALLRPCESIPKPWMMVLPANWSNFWLHSGARHS